MEIHSLSFGRRDNYYDRLGAIYPRNPYGTHAYMTSHGHHRQERSHPSKQDTDGEELSTVAN